VNASLKRAPLPRDLAARNGFDRKTMAAFQSAVRRYSGKPWVVGVAIGIKEQGGKLDTSHGAVIVIHVTKKLKRVPRAKKIPEFILGVPTDVIAGNYTKADAVVGIPQPPVFPLRPGSSIGRVVGGTAASLAGVVRDKNGVRYLLCAGHTLREGGNFGQGDPIGHPGPADSAGAISTVGRFHKVHLGMDAGLATLEPGIAVNNTALLSNTQILAPDYAIDGDILEKSGRTTGITQGVVQSIGTFGVLYPVAYLRPLPGDTNPISQDGDSGSMWYDAFTANARALHVAVDLTTGRSVGTLAKSITDKLKVTWE
jgi:hypothetical protein